MKLLGEIRSQSLLGERGLRQSSINGSSLLTFADSLISSTYLPHAVKSNKRPSYFAAMKKVEAYGLTIENILTTSTSKIDELIYPVGFWKMSKFLC